MAESLLGSHATMRAPPGITAALVLCSALPATRSAAQDATSRRHQLLAKATVTERLGTVVDRELAFVDHEGRAVKLGDYLDGKRPLLLTLNYFQCRMLCNLQLEQLAQTLRKLGTPASDYRVLTVSIDPRDRASTAGERRRAYVARAGGEVDWSFAVGTAQASRALADALGFSYALDERTGQFAHPAMLFALSPGGKVARYLYGVDYSPAELRFALLEAAAGRTGSTAYRALLACYRYDPSAGRYTLSVISLVRLGGGLTLCSMLVLVGAALLNERRNPARPRVRSAP